VRSGLQSLTGPVPPFALFVPAVASVAWYGGLRPGVGDRIPFVRGWRLFPQDAWSENRISPDQPGPSSCGSSTAICVVVMALRSARRKGGGTGCGGRNNGRSLNAVLESTQDAVVSLDREFRCTYVNQNAARMVHHTVADPVGKETSGKCFPQLLGKRGGKFCSARWPDQVTGSLRKALRTDRRVLEGTSIRRGMAVKSVSPRHHGAKKTAEASRAALAAATSGKTSASPRWLQDLPIAVSVLPKISPWRLPISAGQRDVRAGNHARPQFPGIRTGTLRAGGASWLSPRRESRNAHSAGRKSFVQPGGGVHPAGMAKRWPWSSTAFL